MTLDSKWARMLKKLTLAKNLARCQFASSNNRGFNTTHAWHDYIGDEQIWS